MVTLCWAAKGGSGTTVVAAALALASTRPSLLVDLDGEMPAVLGLPEPDRPGVAEWLASDTSPDHLAELLIDIGPRTWLLPWRAGALGFGRGDDVVNAARWGTLGDWLHDWSNQWGCDVTVDVGTRIPPEPFASRASRVTPRHPPLLPLAATSRATPGAADRCDPRRRARARSSPSATSNTSSAYGSRQSSASIRACRRAVDAGLLAASTPTGDHAGASTGGRMTDHDRRSHRVRPRRRRPGDPTSTGPVPRSARLAPLEFTEARIRLVDRAIAQLRGLGELDAIVRDETVDEVLVNAGGEIWIDRDGTLQYVGSLGPTASTCSSNACSHRSAAGSTAPHRSSTPGSPTAHGSAPCSRPSRSTDRPCRYVDFDGTALPLDAFTDTAAARSSPGATGRCNLVVSGATSSGKTSLVAALLADRCRRSDSSWSKTPQNFRCGIPCVRLEARPATVDGPGAIELAHSYVLHCGCDPTGSWSARSAATRCSRSSRR